MALARFHRLSEEERRRLLDVAAAEFARDGFRGASYNRILLRAGISKGAAYYAIDNKEDLYVKVLEDASARFFAHVGPVAAAMAEVRTPARFWTVVEALWRRSLEFDRAHRDLAALVRGLIRGTPAPEGSTAAIARLQAMSHAWLAELIAVGRRVRAVTTPLPDPLLVRVVDGVVNAADLYLDDTYGQALDDATLARHVRALVGAVRRLATKGAR
jgi:AcrR family transcriptional regulator